MSAAAAQARHNGEVWARGDWLGLYATRDLRPVEADVLLRYRGDLRDRVLELGCGAGRITGYLAWMAEEAVGIDLSQTMIDYSRARFPRATFDIGDMCDLSAFADGSFGAVIAGCNVIDVLDDAERRRVLSEVRRVLRPRGLLVMSSHNRGYVPRLRTPGQPRTQDPLRFAADVVRMPRRLRNRRRLVHLELDRPEYAILNDSAHEYSLLHYYISRDGQERQLSEEGFELVECLDLEGETIEPGEQAPGTVELHYVARRAL